MAQKLAVLFFIVGTMMLIVYAGLVFWALNLHVFPCETAFPGYTCGQAIWIAWFQKLSAPIIIWAGISALLYLKWGRN